MFKALLYKLAYPLFAKEVEAYHRLNNAILGIHRWCASDAKANLITTHLLEVRDNEIYHFDDTFRERLRAIDKPTVTSDRKPYTRPDGTPVTSDRKPYTRPDGTKVTSGDAAHQGSMAAAIADDDNFRKGCGSHEAAWSGSDDSCSSSSSSSSSGGD
jgi:hypothetical protein